MIILVATAGGVDTIGTPAVILPVLVIVVVVVPVVEPSLPMLMW